MAETIKQSFPLGDESTFRSVEVKIGKGGSNAPANGTVIPAGYPVFDSSVSGQEYDVFNKTGVASAIATTAVGILMEDWTVSATQTACKVAYAGEFYMDAMYDRCGTLLPVADVTKKMLRNCKGHVVYTDRVVKQLYNN